MSEQGDFVEISMIRSDSLSEVILRSLIQAVFESPGSPISMDTSPDGSIRMGYSTSPLAPVLGLILSVINQNKQRLEALLWEALESRVERLADLLVPSVVDKAFTRKTGTYSNGYVDVYEMAPWLQAPLTEAIAEHLQPVAERLVAERLGDNVTLADIEAKLKIKIVSKEG